MVASNRRRKMLRGATLVTAALMLCFFFCTSLRQPIRENRIDTPIKDIEKACIDIHGYVLGAIRSNATIYLYRTPSLQFDFVLKTVRTAVPYQVSQVNDSKEFKFPCLIHGQYVLAVPSDAYQNRSVGSPLPHETINENFSVNVVFQGGDYEYLVGAFIIFTRENN